MTVEITPALLDQLREELATVLAHGAPDALFELDIPTATAILEALDMTARASIAQHRTPGYSRAHPLKAEG